MTVVKSVTAGNSISREIALLITVSGMAAITHTEKNVATEIYGSSSLL